MKSKIVISTATGFTENNINLSLSQGMGQIGSTVQGQAVQSKDMVFTGMIVGDASAARRQLIRAIEPLVPARLIYNGEWEINVFPTQTPVITKHLTNANFQFTLKAPFPYWTNNTGITAVFFGIEGLFKFPWDLSEPFSFGRKLTQTLANVRNIGDVDAPFKVVFTAGSDLLNPKITNVATNEYLRVFTPMTLGEQLTIDITPMGVSVSLVDKDGVESDVFNRIDIESDLYRLHSGDNFLQYSAESANPSSSEDFIVDVAVYFNILRVGVYD